MTQPLSGLRGIWGWLTQGSDGKEGGRRNPGLIDGTSLRFSAARWVGGLEDDDRGICGIREMGRKLIFLRRGAGTAKGWEMKSKKWGQKDGIILERKQETGQTITLHFVTEAYRGIPSSVGGGGEFRCFPLSSDS